MSKLVPLTVPKAVLYQHVIALGKTGSGKSSKIRVMVEWLLGHGKPVCIIDVKGDWWGLKSSADGRSPGFPLVIFGGKHADIALNPNAGAAIAELVLTGNRPCIIDIHELRPGERTRFFIDFVETAFRVTQGARYLVIPECHNFAPKGRVLSVQAGEMLHWANRLASEGRGLGLTLLADSQRPQKVHNDFLDSCETLIACRTIHKSGREAIKAWIDGCADAEIGTTVLKSIAGMNRTEAYVWSPEIEYGPTRLMFPMFATYDSFKPRAATTRRLKGWASVNLSEVRTRLAAVVAEVEANDPEILKREVKALKAELAKATAAAKAPQRLAAAPGASPREVQAAERAGFERGCAATREAAEREAHRTVSAALNPQKAAVGKLRQRLTEALVEVSKAQNALDGVKLPKLPPAVAPRPMAAAVAHALRLETPVSSKAKRHQVAPVVPRAAGTAHLGKCELKILTVLSQFPEGCNAGKLTLLTGYFYSGNFQNSLGTLRREGFLVGANTETMRITEDGMAQGPFPELPQGDELLQYWLTHPAFGKAHRAILKALADRPAGATAEELCSATGYAYSGNFQNSLGALRTAGVLVGKNTERMRLSQEILP